MKFESVNSFAEPQVKDFSALGLIDSVKAVSELSAKLSCANSKQICKLSSAQVLHYISQLPISKTLEFVL
jgi:hypothetical protein